MQKLSLADYQEEVCKLTYKGKTYGMTLGKVESAELSYDLDHGMLTCWITFGFQSFGGYQLDTYHKTWKKSTGKLSPAGKDWINRAKKVLNVDNIEDAKGKIVFALYDKEGLDRLIVGIKSPEFENNEVFLISDWAERWKFK